MKFSLKGRHLNRVLLLTILIFGLATRLVYLFGSSFTPDESTYGLVMAHILNGKPWPVFFYAQPYTGTQSAILAAFLAKAFGFWPYFLKLIPLVASVGLIWANYFLAKLIYKGKRQEWVGLTAALLTALLPSFAQNWGVRAGSGYPEVVLVGSLCLILGVGVLRAKPVTRARHAAPLQWLVSIEGRFFVLGLLAGFGYWVQPAIVYYLLPLAFLIFLWEPKFFLKRWFHLALLGVIIGAAPVIWFNIQNDLYTGRALFAKPGGIKNAFLIFFTEGMPVILGTRASWSRVDHFLPLAVVVWVAYGVAFFVPAWDLLKRVAFLRQAGQAFHRVKGVKEVFLKDARVLLLLVVLVTPFIFAISPFNWFVVEPRYIYAPLYSTLPVLLGGLLLVEIPKHRSYKSYMTYVLLVLVLASNLLSMTAPSRNSRPDSFETQTNLTPVIEFLRERNVHYVYSSFMFCHRLVFESQEDVICTPFEGGFGEVRYPQYKEMVVNAPKEERGFVFLVRGGGEQETADNYTPALESCKEDTSQQNDPCHEQIIGPFRVSWYR